MLLCAVAAVYSNHFQNDFHFDDWHTITNNPHLRQLGNVPRFFADARTMSVFPGNQAYRPLLTTSLALDYWLGGGLNPIYFHASTFFWLLIHLSLIVLLFDRVLRIAAPEPRARYAALAAAAWYGLNPVCAETINYIVQRADLYVALSMVAGITTYAALPRARRWRLYLLPPALGVLCKPTALIFPALLALYLVFCEPERWTGIVRRSAPAVAAAAAMGALQSYMTPRSFSGGGAALYNYVITQPRVSLHYFLSFFLPAGLSADTDRKAYETMWNDSVFLGFLFLAALLAAAAAAARVPRTRPIAFGLLWFLIAQIPTAVFPLAEVESDHRMFLPAIGLALAVTWGGVLLWDRWAPRGATPRIAIAATVCLLLVYAAAAYQRNEVWRTEESLWLDVTRKSPNNGRGLMNYGLTQMKKGEYQTALAYFDRAAAFTPNYSILEINLGIVNGSLNRDQKAEAHFRRALSLTPNDSLAHHYYARWLKTKGRTTEAVAHLREAIRANPADPEPRYLLLEIHADAKNWSELQVLADDTFRHLPGDAKVMGFLTLREQTRGEVAQAEERAKQSPTPENLLQLSLLYHQAGQFADCIRAAREAIRLRPDYAEAYNNIAAGHEALGQWDEAIAAATQALRIKPDYALARNNLVYAEQQKKSAAAPRSR